MAEPTTLSPLTTLEMAEVSGALRKAIGTLVKHRDDARLNEIHERLTAIRTDLNAYHYGANEPA